jgi:hypothetical protein
MENEFKFSIPDPHLDHSSQCLKCSSRNARIMNGDRNVPPCPELKFIMDEWREQRAEAYKKWKEKQK